MYAMNALSASADQCQLHRITARACKRVVAVMAYSRRMAVSRDFVTYILDQLAGVGSVVERRMFGGVGLYHDGLFFGLIDDDTLYFRVDDASRPQYVAKGMEPFRPVRDAPEKTTPNYFQVPGEILEDMEACADWAREAVRVARAPKPSIKRERPARTAQVPTKRARTKRTAPAPQPPAAAKRRSPT
jgi:DNA transformation protein